MSTVGQTETQTQERIDHPGMQIPSKVVVLSILSVGFKSFPVAPSSAPGPAAAVH